LFDVRCANIKSGYVVEHHAVYKELAESQLVNNSRYKYLKKSKVSLVE